MKCPKCSGLMRRDSDQYSEFASCLICGLRIDKPVTPVIPMTPSILERRLHPEEAKAERVSRKINDG